MRGSVERNDDLMDTFAARMKEARDLIGMSQRQLAELSGIDRNVIANIESRRKVTVNLDHAIRLAAALRVPLSALAPQATQSSEVALAIAERRLLQQDDLARIAHAEAALDAAQSFLDGARSEMRALRSAAR